jgi:hypothetical protein
MGIQFSCGGCGAGFAVNYSDVGRLCKCHQCGTVMRVPRRSSGNHFDTGEPTGAGAAASGGSTEGTVAFSAPARGPTATPVVADANARPALGIAELPTGTKRKPGYFRMRLILIGLGIGAALLTWGVKEVRLAAAAAASPQRLTCRELAEAGPGANAHVILTDFVVATNGAYYKSNKDQADWTTIWLPLLPRGGASAAAAAKPSIGVTLASQISTRPGSGAAANGGIQILLKSNHIHNQGELTPLYYQRELEGMVVNCVDSVASKEMDVLRIQYPNTDFSKCWILEEGRKPATLAMRIGLLSGGAVCMLFALALFAYRPRETAL